MKSGEMRGLGVVEHDPIAGVAGSEVVHGLVHLTHRMGATFRIDALNGYP